MQKDNSLLKLLQEPLKSGRIQLPPFNATALKIQSESAKKNPDTQLIEKLIMSDQALTSKILRVANSAFYRGLSEVSTVQNAIVRLGTQEVANMVMMVTQQGHYKAKNAYISKMMRDLWQHSVGCAIASNWICKQTGLNHLLHESFFAGLLHDVGKLFLLTMLDRIKKTAPPNIQITEALINELVNSRLHTIHGYELMKKWHLPQEYCEITRDHHLEDVDKDNILRVAVQLGNKACNNLNIGLRNDPTVSLSATEEADILGLGEIDLAKLEIKLEDSKMLSG